MSDTVANILQVFACYQCVYGKEPCEYLPKDDTELCTHYKWRYEQLFDGEEQGEEQEHE